MLRVVGVWLFYCIASSALGVGPSRAIGQQPEPPYWYCWVQTSFPGGQQAIYITPVFPAIATSGSEDAREAAFNAYRSSLISWAVPKFNLNLALTSALCSGYASRPEAEKEHSQRLHPYQSPYPGQPLLQVNPVDFIPSDNALKREDVPAVAGSWKCRADLVRAPAQGTGTSRYFSFGLGLIIPEHATVVGGDPSFYYAANISAAAVNDDVGANKRLESDLVNGCPNAYKWKPDGSIYVVPSHLHDDCDVATFSTNFNGEHLSGTLDIHRYNHRVAANIACTRFRDQ